MHVKQAVALNARRVSNVELVEKPVNGITHITLSICLCPSHRHFPKDLFSSRFRTGLPACAGHAD